jgi:hypothetical protein
MIDKQRAEFVGRWAHKIDWEFNDTEPEYRKAIDQMLAEYDKLNGDRWARVKEFVWTMRKQLSWYYGHQEIQIVRENLDNILAEIERLENQGKEDADDKRRET